MEHKRKQKLLIILALVLVIASLSIGFAAFSVSLNISSSASVSPNDADFSVKFSILSAIVQEGNVSPETSSNSLNATSGVIDNSVVPTIKNLSVTFTKPGQYVDYWFFIVNSGKYNAFLNNINFLGDKICVGTDNATDSLVQEACDNINVSVMVGETEYFESTSVSGKMLSANKSENIRVRLSYDASGSYVDGNFSVIFPNVALVYSTLDDSTIEPIVVSRIPQIVSGDLDTLGSVVSIGNEKFYVFGQESGNVKLLAMYNLYVGNSVDANWNVTPLLNPTGIQDSSAVGVKYSPLNFPLIGITKYSSNGSLSYSGSLVEGYVNNYASYLRKMGVNISNARLITIEELLELGCREWSYCSEEHSWVYSTSYWTSSVLDDVYIWTMYEGRPEDSGGFNSDNTLGVRPVIEIPLSEF